MSTEEQHKEETAAVQEEAVSKEKKQEETKVEEVNEPTAEELIQTEKDKYLRLFAEFENYKKRTL